MLDQILSSYDVCMDIISRFYMHEVMHEVVYTFKLVNSLLQVEEFRFLSLKTKRFRVMNCVKNNVL